MSDLPPIEFLLPDFFSIETIASPGKLVPMGDRRIHLALLDTFDRRLLNAGVWLAIEKDEHGRQRCMAQSNEGIREIRPWTGAFPKFSGDLRELAGHESLARILGVRALLPQIEVTGTLAEWVVEPNDGAAGVTVCLEALAVKEGRRRRPLPGRLRLIPMKGFRKEFRALVDSLRTESGLRIADSTLYRDAVNELGPALPMTVIPQTVIDDPDIRSDRAVKLVLRQLLATMYMNEPGLLTEIDTEFLHDFRVAVRRTRAVLGQMGGALPPVLLERFRRGFADLAQATSVARDFDVFLLSLEGLDQQLPVTMRGQLQPLTAEVMLWSQRAHEALNARLQSTTHRRFMDAWTSFLERPPPRRPSAGKARMPVHQLACARTWKLYRRLLREGKAITPESPSEDLHALRKTAKKLRYQMELFQSLYPADEIQPLLRRLKKLQTHLGEYQDMAVQAGHLRDLAAVLRDKEVPIDTLLAMGALLGHLHRQEAELRDRFSAWFGEFSGHKYRRRFRQLFRPDALPDTEDKPEAKR